MSFGGTGRAGRRVPRPRWSRSCSVMVIKDQCRCREVFSYLLPVAILCPPFSPLSTVSPPISGAFRYKSSRAHHRTTHLAPLHVVPRTSHSSSPSTAHLSKWLKSSSQVLPVRVLHRDLENTPLIETATSRSVFSSLLHIMPRRTPISAP